MNRNDPSYTTLEENIENPSSQFFILVCNVPDPGFLNAQQRTIVQGMTAKIHKKHEADINIIYIDALKDEPYSPKFAVLANANHLSRIYIVGHCSPGSDGIVSDKVYKDENHPGKKKKGFVHYELIGDILLHNIVDKSVLATRKNPIENSLTQRLKICVPACYSGVDKSPEQKSFAWKLFNYCLNENQGRYIKCDVIANTGLVAPLPLAAKIKLSSFPELLKFIFKIEFQATDFHKRHLLFQNSNASRILNYLPRHQPDNIDYKIAFIIPLSTTHDDVKNSQIHFEVLSVKTLKEWMDIQRKATHLLSVCDQILERKTSDDLSQLSLEIRKKILNWPVERIDSREALFASVRYFLDQSLSALEQEYSHQNLSLRS